MKNVPLHWWGKIYISYKLLKFDISMALNSVGELSKITIAIREYLSANYRIETSIKCYLYMWIFIRLYFLIIPIFLAKRMRVLKSKHQERRQITTFLERFNVPTLIYLMWSTSLLNDCIVSFKTVFLCLNAFKLIVS